MSIRMMTIVWDVPFPTSTQMLIALKLADYSNDHGTSIFPANETLASKARCSESTVKTTLKVFRACGLLMLLKQGGSGPKSTNEWALNVPLLKALASGICTIDGCSTVLEIDGEMPVENKGSEFDPLDQKRGQFDALRGQPTDAKGSAHRPQSTNNHQIDPSTREGARKADDLILKRSGEPEIAVSVGEMQWESWIAHLSEHDPPKAEQAKAAGQIFVTGRWPSERTRVLRIPASGLSEKTKAMVGGE